MSLFGELKRRNVAKVAMLYVVASWLLMQVADVLFGALELPAAWDRLVLALVILGFPIVRERFPDGANSLHVDVAVDPQTVRSICTATFEAHRVHQRERTEHKRKPLG